MNYRSVVVLGKGEAVDDTEEREVALRAIVEHTLAGRWDEVRLPNAKELAATLVLKIPLEEASAKVRIGPPLDDEADLGFPCWAGVVPLALTPAAPENDPTLPAGVALAASVRAYLTAAEGSQPRRR
jgi:hypothetical protein